MSRGLDFAALSAADQRAAGFDPAQAAGLFVGVRRFVAQSGEASTEFLEIPYAVNDAIDLAAMFVLELKLIPARNVHLLLSGEPVTQAREETLSRLKAAGVVLGQPTYSALIDALVTTRDRAKAQGLLLVSMASHGISLGGQDRILCLNSRTGELLETTSIAWSLLSQVLQKSDCKRVLTLLDACRENVSGARGTGARLPNTLSEAITRVKGMAVLCGAPPGGYCFDDADSKNGAFTAHLLRGLREGAQADEQGHVTLERLAAWVDLNLKQWLKKQEKAQEGITLRLEPQGIGALPLAFRPSQVEESREALKEKWALEVKAREAAEQALSRLQEALSARSAELAVAQGEVHRLKEALRAQEAADQGGVAAQERLKAELAVKTQALETAERSLQGAEQALKELQSELERTKEALKDKEASLVSAQQALRQKEGKLTEAEKALTDKDAALKSAQQALNGSQSALKKKELELNTAQADLATKAQALGSAEQALRESKAEREKLQKENRGLDVLSAALFISLLALGAYTWLRPGPVTQLFGETQTALPGTDQPITWVYVPAGEFMMGSDDGALDEKPPHKVKLSAFKLSKTEVTVAQYDACVKAGKCTELDTGGDCNWKVSGRENHPINCVDWDQAKAFTVWLSGVTGEDVRLPSEAQWEYAARGPEGKKYPWGNADPTPELANFARNVGRTTPVGQYAKGASWVGALDMAGNVWEWTEDCWHEGYTKAPDDGSAWAEAGMVPAYWADASKNPLKVSEQDPLNIRVVRGGGWNNDADRVRGANRGGGHVRGRGTDQGFRVVALSPPAGGH